MGREMLDAFSAARAPLEEDMRENVNPASSNETGDVVYLPSHLIPEGAKQGDKVTVSAEVVSVGSKLGIRPDSVVPESGEPEQQV